MSGTKPDILWAPHQVDRFVVCDSELSLYHVESTVNSELKAGSLRLSEDSAATLLSINSDTPYMKCVAWYLNYDPECLLAVGQANGRVVLTSLGQDHNSKFKDLIGKEFVPKHARQCNTLAWNPLDSNWLAAGLDKHRADFSVLIWDICSKYTPDIVPMEKVKLSAGETETTLLVTKPLYELGQNDACLSLCWLPRDQKLLLAGMHRNLAIFDLRNTSQKMFVNTKAVQGVTVDPYFHDRVASFYEGQVAIWDLRKFEKPVLTLTEQPKPLTKVAWCPTRTGLLATLTRDSNIIRLYDMQHTPTPIGDETEPTIIERSVQPCDNYIASFAWHPTSQNRMIVVTPNRTMSDFTVFERISLAWSPITSLMWACGRHLYECTEEENDNSLEKDIATKMRLRALSRYGLDTEQVWRNHILAGNEDPQLKSLWYTLHFMKQYTEDMDQKSPGNKGSLVYAGIKSIVKSSLGMVESSRHNWSGLDKQSDIQNLNEERILALQLCGWIKKGTDVDVGPFLNSLVQEGEWERAAAVALFNLDIRRAIQILNEGASSEKGDLNLNVVAMALSGYTDEKNSLWREMCSTLRLQLNNPYLCVMFAFLTSETGSYDGVLYENKVAVRDRVAFACKFLSDTQLNRYIEKLTNEMKEAGNLEGILLTGLTKDGVDLMESYVDRTGDVQTASYCMLQVSAVARNVCFNGRQGSFSFVIGGTKSDEKVDLSKDKKLAQFNNWFTWCHNCRHGGHAGHMLSWFRDHAECPVSACTCKCMQLDTTGNLVPAEAVQP
ncbi:PREDICTED: WD repeat-containing protein mio [Cercocebus atys]|uniref:WD repeat-containing protein mio n=1 Tax=Cercocebus atys TaxID=9531 RepID=UPI0005F3B5E8|nr:PREDICTED: WD repeat-containing protein mio [Cercocebus atys]